MGTRHLTVVYNKDGTEIINMYGQYDGYPGGHGIDLAEFLDGMRIVNGLSMDDDKIANGMCCLAAQVIAHFKREAGGFYMQAPGVRDVGEEFIYHITNKDGYPNIKLTKGPVTFFGVSSLDAQGKHADEVVFDGSPKEFIEWVEKDSSEDV